MKLFDYKNFWRIGERGQLFSVWIALLLGAASFAFTSTLLANPIYDGPANSPNYCMADAYAATGGKGLKDTLGASLNCTANDVEITTVTVKSVDGNGPDGDGNFTCTKDELIVVTADLRVRTNANERWDTTFFLPLNQQSPQVIQQDDSACSIVIPKNEFAIDSDSGVLVAQDLDGDACGDIAKGPLVNDEYTLVDATFTMLCDAGDDTQVDFVYCAGWDNQERNNCEVNDTYPGQEPNTTSKCNCGDIPLNIFIQPEPPLVTKTLKSPIPGEANEPSGTYTYTIKVETQTPDANLNVTALSDYVWSLTDADGTLYSFNLNNSSDVTQGNVTLLGSNANYTCDEVSLPKVLNTSTLSFSCDIVVRIDDEDLPNDQSNEVYWDVVKVIAEDDNGDNIGECIEPLGGGAKVDGTCSIEVPVAVKNVEPVLSIEKFAIAGPGYGCTGSIDIDGRCDAVDFILEPGGDVTYKLIISNLSTVDAVTLTSLVDTVEGSGLDLSANITGNTCDDGWPKTLAKKDAVGDSFTCTFKRDVSGEPRTVRNDIEVKGVDNEMDEATKTDFEEVMINDVAPTLTLVKEVKVAGTNDPFSDDATVDEPEGDVVYRFTIDNTSPSGESITLKSFVDPVLNSARVTITDDQCNFTSTVVTVATDYVCTIAATVTGEPSSSPLKNTAYVTAMDNDGNTVQSNDDSANVHFKDVLPSIAMDLEIDFTIFVTINNTSTFEDVTLEEVNISDLAVPDVGTATNPLSFDVLNSTCVTDGTEVISAGDDYVCQFDVHMLATENDATENVFKYDTSDVVAYANNLADLVEVVVKDNEDNEANDVANVTVQLNEE